MLHAAVSYQMTAYRIYFELCMDKAEIRKEYGESKPCAASFASA